MKTILHVFFFKLTIISFTIGYDDLSLRKPTNQSQGYDARYAVDGIQSTCMNTVDGSPVTWYVDLQEVKSIAKIWIFYNTSDHQRRYVNNYLVYLSNTTRWRDGFLCINESGPSIALPGTVKQCQMFARYVIFHNTKDSGSMFKFSLVCEVKVEGCNKKGVYGSYCDKQCPENCYGSRCYLEGGDCYYCNDGWTGNKCQTTCPFGRYGPGCIHRCRGHCVRNSTCDPVTGLCKDGCAPGWGGNCLLTCAPEWYGTNCSKPCSKNCLNGRCHADDGSCIGGCKSGWMNKTCNQACPFGRYGPGCIHRCRGHCVRNSTCNPVTGLCKDGCAPGWGGNCPFTCAPEWYGTNCSKPCSKNCLNGRCHADDGSCIGGCKSGWMNKTCNQVCPSGFYGKNCSHNCSRRCYGNRTCDPVNGSCRICAEEYIGEKCDQLRIKQPRDTDTVPLAVIVAAPTSVLVLVAIVVTVICFRRRFLKCCEKSQTPGNDVAVTVDDSHPYETLNFSRKHM